ncbi:MAG: hypothetical protein ACM3NV_09870 [Syntrophothermus sp.]
MASGGKEHRMVFDIRGRRGVVIKVVYAALALLMGLSLFLVVGPVNINALLGNGGGGSSSAAQPYEEQAERLEAKLRKSPEDEELLAALTRARINAGTGSVEEGPEGQTVYTTETIQQYQLASEAWSDYLKATKEPSPALAQVIAPILATLAEASSTGEFEANIKGAADAQQIYAEQRPSINALTTLAIYRYFSFDYKAAKKSEAEAIALAKDKFERESIENQMQEYEKRARELQKKLKEQEQANKAAGGAAGKEGLENPLGGLGGSSLGE